MTQKIMTADKKAQGNRQVKRRLSHLFSKNDSDSDARVFCCKKKTMKKKKQQFS